MKNILKKAENAEKLLNLTSDTMILLDRDGVCVDIAVHNVNLWFLTEDQLLDKNLLQLLPPSTYRQIHPSEDHCRHRETRFWKRDTGKSLYSTISA